jgi:hypothetical protein
LLASGSHREPGGNMTTARTSLEHVTPAAGDPDQLARRYPRASKLFEKDHAYAARLVQIATAISSVVRSAVATKLPDRDSSAIQEDDGITSGIVGKTRLHGSGR